MLGLLRPCLRGDDPDLRDRWRAHMCGVCLALRDGHGQWARPALNTDAIVASILVEAQQPTPHDRVRAGRCALRGMRRAQVVSPGSPGARLGSTVSLTLVSAKAVDTSAEHDLGLSGRSPVRSAVAGAVAAPLRRRAVRDPRIADAIGVEELFDRVGHQAAVESRSTDLDEITATTAHACAAVFAATACLAGRPENRQGLAGVGAAFGRCGHLLDAVADLDDDRARGAYNPLDATGTTVDEARAECLRLHREITDGVRDLALSDDALVRATLVRGLHHAITRTFAAPASSARSSRTPAVLGALLCAAAPGPFDKPAEDEENEGCIRSCLSECCSDCCEDCCCDSCCDCCT